MWTEYALSIAGQYDVIAHKIMSVSNGSHCPGGRDWATGHTKFENSCVGATAFGIPANGESRINSVLLPFVAPANRYHGILLKFCFGYCRVSATNDKLQITFLCRTAAAASFVCRTHVWPNWFVLRLPISISSIYFNQLLWHVRFCIDCQVLKL